MLKSLAFGSFFNPHPFAVEIVAVPREGAALASALGHECACGSDDLHVGVVAQSCDGNGATVVWANGIGIGVGGLLVHRLRGLRGVAQIGAETLVGADEDLSRLGVDGQRLDVVAHEATVGGKKMVNLRVEVCADEIDAVAARAKPLAVAAIDGHAGDVDVGEQVVGEVAAVVAWHLVLLEDHASGIG